MFRTFFSSNPPALLSGLLFAMQPAAVLGPVSMAEVA